MIDNQTFVEIFREAVPYIHSHHGKTFVVQTGGDVIASENFTRVIHDLAILNSLGIKLVVVPGVRPQIDVLLKEKNITPEYCGSLRVTNEASINCVTQAVGEVKIKIEALLSMGLPNAPMIKPSIKVASGNFVTGRPYGVLKGIDLNLTGRVRSVEKDAIRKRLDVGEIVLITPLGYSSTGQIFNLSSIEVAAQVATQLLADKLIMLGITDELEDTNGKIIRQLTCEQAKEKSGSGHVNNIDETPATALAQGVMACEAGVNRVHYIDQAIDGGILHELFTRDGIGTLLSSQPFDAVRQATANDTGGIYELIVPLMQQEILIERSREKIEDEIKDYKILVRDGTVIACAALHDYPEEKVMEITSFAVHPDYQKQSMGDTLYTYLEALAVESGAVSLIALTTQTEHWFIERGFTETNVDTLPVKKQDMYNYQRNSKALIKHLRNL